MNKDYARGFRRGYIQGQKDLADCINNEGGCDYIHGVGEKVDMRKIKVIEY